MTEGLYPLKFKTIFKDKIWGGSKIRDVLGKDFAPLPNCGETWELSGVKDNVSLVSNGPMAGDSLNDVIQRYQEGLLGTKVVKQFGLEFPLLIKFIDAADDLSVQVHPNDDQASDRHDSRGKTEMWYVIDAEPHARLISGFTKDLSKEEYLRALGDNSIMGLMNWEPVYDDDVFFIPAGKVHSIGKGILLAEIQETSDITYRIYDFDRVDANGNLRPLHNQEAMDVINFTAAGQEKVGYTDVKNFPVGLVDCDYFTTNKLELDQSLQRAFSGNSFTIYICLDGSATISETTSISKGEVVLVPASIMDITIAPVPYAKLLEVYIS